MNDFREIEHGMECLTAAWRAAGGETLRSAIDSSFPGLSVEIETMYTKLVPLIRADTYLACVSEHPANEDRRGRLSMWRAYGGKTGVALVMNGAVMHSESLALGVLSSPVLYADALGFAREFESLAAGIAEHGELLKRLGRDQTRDVIVHMLRFAVLCTKHPAFEEEREWRVIASPAMWSTARLEAELEVVRGVPQRVLKIRLENATEEDLHGLAVPELIERVIVGPCEFPKVTALAFMEQLEKLGVPNAAERVTIADVPLRHQS